MGGKIFLKHRVVDVLIFNAIVDDIIELSEGLIVWHNVSMHAPEVIIQLPLSVCLEGASFAQERQVLVNVSDVSSQVFWANG